MVRCGGPSVQAVRYGGLSVQELPIEPPPYKQMAQRRRQLDRFRLVRALAAQPAINTITHTLGVTAVAVEVRNNTTGETIEVRVVNESFNQFDILVPVAYPAARITIT